MIFDRDDLQIDVLKKFDGVYNYLNPSHFSGRTIYRRQVKFDNRILVGDIVDENDNVLLEHHVDDNYLWSYEDARLIDDQHFGLSACKIDKNDINKVINVEFKKYNFVTKELTNYKTQNAYYEKHWQYYKKYIIYHVNPFTLMDNKENVVFRYNINWNPWIEKYGRPGLSTNVFEINGSKYLLYHSYDYNNGINLIYHVGVLKLNSLFNPVTHTSVSMFPSMVKFDIETMFNYYNWKRKLDSFPTIVDVVFPMSVVVDDVNVNIYSGINDCICANIKIDKRVFVEKIKKSMVLFTNQPET